MSDGCGTCGRMVGLDRRGMPVKHKDPISKKWCVRSETAQLSWMQRLYAWRQSFRTPAKTPRPKYNDLIDEEE